MTLSPAGALVYGRLSREEGDRNAAYDDATGKPIVLPEGHNLTWGRGFNLAAIASPALFDVIEQHLIGAIEAQLLSIGWYASAPVPIQSVFLDIAYNGGVAGLLQGYPRMVQFARVHDWKNVAAQCSVARPDLDHSRYAPLRAIILGAIDT